MFRLICKDKNNNIKTFKYDQLNNSILDEETNKYIEYKFERSEARKSFIKNYKIRIAMGKKCNANCRYCLQDKNAPVYDFNIEFVDKLIELTKGNIVNIQFWGGDPLVYFDKIVQLCERFKKHMGDKTPPGLFGICTNGILFKEKYIRDWILTNKQFFGFNFSHDGPGQILRGQDPLKNKDIVNFLKEIANTMEWFSVNPVMSKYNQDLLEYSKYIDNILDTEHVPLSESRPVMITDENSLKCAMNDEELINYSKRTTYQLLTYKLQHWIFTQDIFDYMTHYLNKQYKPGARCFVGDKKTIVLDTEGNLIPCQGFNKNSVDQYGKSMYLGNIFDIKDVTELKLFKPTRLIEIQEKCKQCLLANVCSNGCPFGPIKYEEINCKYSFYYMLPHFIKNIYYLTDTLIMKIEEI